MIRVYLRPEQWSSETVLTGEEAHHLARVLRVKEGETVLCLDGRGGQANGKVVRLSSKEVVLFLESPTTAAQEIPSITLAAAVPGQGKIEEIINQAVQLGVAGFIPMLTQRTEFKLSGDRLEAKQRRFYQVAIEAMKQSGSLFLPEVAPVTSWKELLASFPEYDLVLIASLEGPYPPLKPAISSLKPSRILILIGPEGDFTLEEVDQAVAAGALRFSLGSNVLRCETAAIAAVSIVSHLARQNP